MASALPCLMVRGCDGAQPVLRAWPANAAMNVRAAAKARRVTAAVIDRVHPTVARWLVWHRFSMPPCNSAALPQERSGFSRRATRTACDDR